MIVYYPKGIPFKPKSPEILLKGTKNFGKLIWKILFKLLRLSSFPEIRKFWKFSVPLGFSIWYNLILVFLVVSVKKTLTKLIYKMVACRKFRSACEVKTICHSLNQFLTSHPPQEQYNLLFWNNDWSPDKLPMGIWPVSIIACNRISQISLIIPKCCLNWWANILEDFAQNNHECLNF